MVATTGACPSRPIRAAGLVCPGPLTWSGPLGDMARFLLKWSVELRPPASRRGGKLLREGSPIDLVEVTNTRDPDIGVMARLMLTTFADANIVLCEDRIREFLGQPDRATRSFHLVVIKDAERLVGGVIFSYMPEGNCGFSEYMVLEREYRGRGLGRALFNARKDVLDRCARACGWSGARGVFIEVENPDRMPPEYAERERVTAMDAAERWRLWDRMGFYRSSVPYMQPPLGPGKEPVYYMDLFFAPWDVNAIRTRQIPQEWVLQTITPIWRGWAPDRYEHFLGWLKDQMGSGPVHLFPLSP